MTGLQVHTHTDLGVLPDVGLGDHAGAVGPGPVSHQFVAARAMSTVT
jgi:hypothetical protein